MNQIVVIGLRRVGKTDIINHITDGMFNLEYYPNKQEEFLVKCVQPHDSYKVNRIFEVQPIYWDNRPYGLVSLYCSIARVIILVIDISAEFNEQYQELCDAAVQTKQRLVVFANKRGTRNRLITYWLSAFCSLNDVDLYEVNSNDPESVVSVFQNMLSMKNKFQLTKYLEPLTNTTLLMLRRATLMLQNLKEFIKEII